MPLFICIHDCMYLGAVCKRGRTVEVSEDALKLPQNARLLQRESFTRQDEPAAPAAAPEPGRAALIQKAKELGLNPKAKATVAELTDMIAEAAAPDGSAPEGPAQQ